MNDKRSSSRWANKDDLCNIKMETQPASPEKVHAKRTPPTLGASPPCGSAGVQLISPVSHTKF